MARAFLDTSCLVSVVLGERGSDTIRRRLARCDELLAAGLLEAELRAVLLREGVGAAPRILGRISWVVPDRHLGPEIAQVLSAGYLRGADSWHLATALFAAGDPSSLPFLTLDPRQGDVAAALGFPT